MSGLREVKRVATRRALAHAALDLVRERGLDGVTIDDIVERLPVSRRTFSNYFSCKEECVAAAVTEGVLDGLDSWSPDPQHRRLAPLVRDLVAHQMSTGALARALEVAELADTHPQFGAFWRASMWQAWRATADRLGRALPDPSPAQERAVVATVGALFAVVLDASADRGALPGAVLQTLELLERGLDR